MLREPVFCALLVGVLSPPFMMTALFFQQLHLVEIKDWTAAAFAIGFTLFAATAVPVGLATGALIDRFSARALLPVFLLPMALALLLAALLEAVWAIYVFMVLLGGTAGAASTISGALWPEVFGVAHLGEIRAV
ncbi:MAG: MFS transporter, partial [Pseudomonadota bacterium]